MKPDLDDYYLVDVIFFSVFNMRVYDLIYYSCVHLTNISCNILPKIMVIVIVLVSYWWGWWGGGWCC